MQGDTKYRETLSGKQRLDFIDGLRAIAIIAVVGFHIGMPGFSGGFVGVDVFFVISGFLIGGQIIDRLDKDRLSLIDFYAQRMLRIFAPLFLVLLVGAGVMFLLPVLPDRIVSANTSATAAAAMLSNQYFVVHAGYFDPASADQPFLHTWSLGVEEQYYVFMPIAAAAVFFAARRCRRDAFTFLLVATTIAFFLSLTLAFLLARHGSKFPFYGMPTRAWEFMVGTIPALLLRRGMIWQAPSSAAGVAIGLIAIVAALPLLNGETGFPGLLMMLPVVGTALALWAGVSDPKSWPAKGLATPVLVALGLVSYGWYLWHWPVLVALRAVDLNDHNFARDFFGAAASLALAAATYWALERPLRRWRHSGFSVERSQAIVRGGLVCLVVVAGGLWGSANWAQDLWHRPTFDRARNAKAKPYGMCHPVVPGSDLICDADISGAPRILTWGDSHAKSIWPAVLDAAKADDANALLLETPSCPPLFETELLDRGRPATGCNDHNRKVFETYVWPPQRTLTGLVLAGWWQKYRGVDASWPITPATTSGRSPEQELRDGLRRTLDALGTSNLRILVIAPIPHLPRPAPECIYLASYLGRGDESCAAERADMEATRAGLMEVMRTKARQYPNMRLIDTADALCDAKACEAAHDGELLYIDSNHLTIAAAHLIYRKFAADFAWAFGGSLSRQ